MAGLTETEKERLRTFGAGVMGWHKETDIVGPHPDGVSPDYVATYWTDDKHAVAVNIHDWKPLVSLDQARLVADRLTDDGRVTGWEAHRGSGGMYYGGVYGIPNGEGRSEKEPAEALLVACADAVGEKWRDG